MNTPARIANPEPTHLALMREQEALRIPTRAELDYIRSQPTVQDRNEAIAALARRNIGPEPKAYFVIGNPSAPYPVHSPSWTAQKDVHRAACDAWWKAYRIECGRIREWLAMPKGVA